VYADLDAHANLQPDSVRYSHAAGDAYGQLQWKHHVDSFAFIDT
jgi:hypothetical protein